MCGSVIDFVCVYLALLAQVCGLRSGIILYCSLRLACAVLQSDKTKKKNATNLVSWFAVNGEKYV